MDLVCEGGVGIVDVVGGVDIYLDVGGYMELGYT